MALSSRFARGTMSQLILSAAWRLVGHSEPWSQSEVIPEYTFDVQAEYRTPTARRSGFSLNVPVFQKVDEIMTQDGTHNVRYQLIVARSRCT